MSNNLYEVGDSNKFWHGVAQATSGLWNRGKKVKWHSRPLPAGHSRLSFLVNPGK